jgi:hypothetical protein
MLDDMREERESFRIKRGTIKSEIEAIKQMAREELY